MFKAIPATLFSWFAEETDLPPKHAKSIRRTKRQILWGLILLSSLLLICLFMQWQHPFKEIYLQNSIAVGLALLATGFLARWWFKDLVPRQGMANTLGGFIIFTMISAVLLKLDIHRIEGIFMWQAIYPMLAAHHKGTKVAILYTFASTTFCMLYLW